MSVGALGCAVREEPFPVAPPEFPPDASVFAPDVFRRPRDVVDVPQPDAGPFAQQSCTLQRPPGCGVVSVPGGTFTMGDEAIEGARPLQREVTVDGFVMDRYEVTVGRFRRFWDAGHPPPGRSVAYPGASMLPWREDSVTLFMMEPQRRPSMGFCNWTEQPDGREDHPVNCITWHAAQAFCVWDGGRLPTEAEWEYAARGMDGGFATPDAGADASLCLSRCVSASSCLGTCRVDESSSAGGFHPFGLWHMAGNVWEWTADNAAPFTDATCWGGATRRNPLCNTGDVPAGTRTVRGGSWGPEHPTRYLVAEREAVTHHTRSASGGFRCVRPMTTTSETPDP